LALVCRLLMLIEFLQYLALLSTYKESGKICFRVARNPNYCAKELSGY